VSTPRFASRRRFIVLCGITPIVLASALAVYRPLVLGRLDNAAYDFLLRSTRTARPSAGIVIVDVDERSLATVGQWPWRRDVVGQLISRLRDAGAAAIALDVIFAESDRGAAEGVASGRTPDAMLAETLSQGRVVLGYAMTFDAVPLASRPCALKPIGVAILRPPADREYDPFFHATGVICNLPILGRAAAAAGFLNAVPDADGILRRAPLVAEFDGRLYPSLALATFMMTRGVRDVALRVTNVNTATLELDGRNVPLDGRSNLLLRYRGKKRTFPYLSAADVLAGAAVGDAVRNRIVMVGTTALGTREVVATPLDTLFAGVEVQATVADNLLQQDNIRRSPLGATLDSVMALIVGIAIVLLVLRVGIVHGIAGGAAGIAALWWSDAWLLSARGLFVSPVAPTLGAVGSLAVMTLATFIVERGRADSASREKTAAQRLMVQALLSLTETRDAETGRHSRRTQQYARLLAEQLATHPDFRAQLTPDRVELLSSLAPIHDIGKVGIPDHVLNKPGPLTADELAEMRTHPVIGRDVILKAQGRVGVRDDATLAMAKDIVYTHHERWDGTGYPEGLHGIDIPLAGRMMALVDVYDAVSARASYSACLSHEDTVQLIVKGRGSHFDPAVVDAFLCVSTQFKRVSEEARSSPDDDLVAPRAVAIE
jgi:CHASE2 domain-containing sensor protein